MRRISTDMLPFEQVGTDFDSYVRDFDSYATEPIVIQGNWTVMHCFRIDAQGIWKVVRGVLADL